MKTPNLCVLTALKIIFLLRLIEIKYLFRILSREALTLEKSVRVT